MIFSESAAQDHGFTWLHILNTTHQMGTWDFWHVILDVENLDG